MEKIKILISTYACEPGKGSEPGVGWNWVKQISCFVDELWVITRANNRRAIEEVLRNEPLPNVHWVYFDLPRWTRVWKREQRGVHLYYYLWQVGIYFRARRLYQKVKFDLVHHVTFGTYWLPSFLVLLPIPFIWGPVGGGESAPKPFYKTFSLRGLFYEYLRSFVRWLGEHDPFLQLTARNAAVGFAKARETALCLSRLKVSKVIIMSEVAWTRGEIQQLTTVPFQTSPPFVLLSLGRLIHWKGFHLGIMAFAQFVKQFCQAEYWIVGNGPEQKNLKKLAQEQGVAEKVRFLGALPRAEALKKLAKCDVLVHPSLHDSGGWVCVEAMAAGRPLICLDLGGPSLQVTKETGIKIPAYSPEQVVSDMADAMLRLASNRDLRFKMGKAAQKRVREEFSWDKKSERLNELYKEVILSI